jgi:hypothetical protein
MGDRLYWRGLYWHSLHGHGLYGQGLCRSRLRTCRLCDIRLRVNRLHGLHVHGLCLWLGLLMGAQGQVSGLAADRVLETAQAGSQRMAHLR